MLLTLDENQVILSFNHEAELSQFLKSPLFKIKIKRYVHSNQGNTIYFEPDLTVHQIQTIKEGLRSQKNAQVPVISEVLEDYLSEKKFYIESRRRVGNDIKKKGENIREHFLSFKKVVDSLMRRPLNEEQMWNAFYMQTMQRSSNFSVPGSGKTATVLGMFAYLKHKGDIDRIVMIGPKNSFGSWIDEYKACFSTDDRFYLNIHDAEMTNTQRRKTALEYESGSKELILINYESVPSLISELGSLIDHKTLLVFDEVHKIKNPKGQRARATKQVTESARYVVALTGTPIPNSYQDIWNLLNILYREDYNHFFGFSLEYLNRAEHSEVALINDKIKPFFCRTSKEQLGVPESNEDILISNLVSEEENRLFKILYQRYKKNLFSLFIRILQLESSPGELLNSIDPTDFEYLIDDESDTPELVEVMDYSKEVVELIRTLAEKRTTKVQDTISLVKGLTAEGKTTIVWCNLIASMNLLKEELEREGIRVKIISGAVPLEERLSLISDFKSRKFEVLITNPHTLAESVSLHTVCHDAIYFEYSYNLVHLLQSKDRIHRLGLKENQYTQYYFLQSRYLYGSDAVSISEKVYHRLLEKEKIMNEAIENDILEKVSSSEEDLEIIFDFLNESEINSQ